MPYNHTFPILFSIDGSNHEKGDDLTADQVREAICKRYRDLMRMPDQELLECTGAGGYGEPNDSYEYEKPLTRKFKAYATVTRHTHYELELEAANREVASQLAQEDIDNNGIESWEEVDQTTSSMTITDIEEVQS